MKTITTLLIVITSGFAVQAQQEDMTHLLQANKIDWRIVNDGVMGGLSQSQVQITKEGHARFAGTVSLENNGGFASTRVDLPAETRTGAERVHIRVKGDGKLYSLRLSPEGKYGRVSYRAMFDTKAGKWQEFTFPLSEFTPTFRGRILGDVPSLDEQSLRELGILIADKQVGAFELIVDWVKID